MFLQDSIGNEIVPDSWLVSCFGNYATMRFYHVNEFADDGRLKVHEYVDSYPEGVYTGETRLRKVKKPQTIQRPKTCIVYPFEMLKHRFAEGELDG